MSKAKTERKVDYGTARNASNIELFGWSKKILIFLKNLKELLEKNY